MAEGEALTWAWTEYGSRDAVIGENRVGVSEEWIETRSWGGPGREGGGVADLNNCTNDCVRSPRLLPLQCGRGRPRECSVILSHGRCILAAEPCQTRTSVGVNSCCGCGVVVRCGILYSINLAETIHIPRGPGRPPFEGLDLPPFRAIGCVPCHAGMRREAKRWMVSENPEQIIIFGPSLVLGGSRHPEARVSLQRRMEERERMAPKTCGRVRPEAGGVRLRDNVHQGVTKRDERKRRAEVGL